MRLSFVLMILGVIFLASCLGPKSTQMEENFGGFDKQAILSKANKSMLLAPITITNTKAERSEGGIHDYFSEGPYWWPDTLNPKGPYIRRDGLRNPDMFTSHRTYLKNFSNDVANLTAAYLITSDKTYADKAITHLDAWLMDEATMMNPHLLYAQAIKGITSGRGIGIIDAIDLRDVSNAIILLNKAKLLDPVKYNAYRDWFSSFNHWLTTHPYGLEEMNNNNNHSTWWGVQVLAYSILTQDTTTRRIALQQFDNQLDIQMAADGSLPHEMERTKPFHYLNYTTQAWIEYAAYASLAGQDLWLAVNKEGIPLKAMADFAYKYNNLKEEWPYKSEVEPERHLSAQPYFYIAGKGFDDDKYIELWQNLNGGQSDHAPLFLLTQLLKK